MDNFITEINKADVTKYIIHARIAIRGNFNTKDNLNVPPLNYERVLKLKDRFKKNKIIINGGFKNVKYNNKLARNIDGIMIGREAYKNPWIFNSSINYKNLDKKISIVVLYINFLKNYFIKKKFNKNALTHIQNIFNGYRGSKEWRRNISYSMKNKDLNNLLKFIDCDNIKSI